MEKNFLTIANVIANVNQYERTISELANFSGMGSFGFRYLVAQLLPSLQCE